MGPHKLARLLFLASVVAFSLAAVAQSGEPHAKVAPGKPQTDQQKKGEAIFHKNCHLCHIHTEQKEELKIISGELIGLFKQPTTNEANVRQVIQQGIPRLMPSFRYNFEPSEMEDLMAYLKIR
jgi:hypothetical protein